MNTYKSVMLAGENIEVFDSILVCEDSSGSNNYRVVHHKTSKGYMYTVYCNDFELLYTGGTAVGAEVALDQFYSLIECGSGA